MLPRCLRLTRRSPRCLATRRHHLLNPKPVKQTEHVLVNKPLAVGQAACCCLKVLYHKKGVKQLMRLK